jgi:Flp pilus assembly CpaE family ATPase
MARATLRPHRGDATTAAGPHLDRLDGPLIAVCGLVGGAGASTLALALAHHAAAHSSAPILLTETSPERGGLAILTRRASPLCLRELAGELAAGQQPAEAFVELNPRLRLVAATPRHTPTTSHDQLTQVLDQARTEHGLVIVDCGQCAGDRACVLNQATHIVWALPPSRSAIRRAHVLLGAGVLPGPGHAHEALVANAIAPPERGTIRELRRLADQRCERLVLVPHSRRLARGDLAGLEDLTDGVAAIAGLIQQTP